MRLGGQVTRSCVVLVLSISFGFSAEKKPVPKPSTDLASRYSRLSCAVVQVIHDSGAGTGFFISADGDILTAAHVALNRNFSEPALSGVNYFFALTTTISPYRRQLLFDS
jgi:hypothetical protein